MSHDPIAASPARPAELDLEPHRRELFGYCYRMLGSPFDAEDAVQETMLRAWRGATRFEGRSSPRSWLYRIATNVCLDMLSTRSRRARPMDLSDSGTVDSPIGDWLPETTWVQPTPDGRAIGVDDDPEALALQRESLRLAFVAALQLLPPRQRAVLILREVLSMSAIEVATLLDASVASVNSALQRARATLARRQGGDPHPEPRPVDADLLERYLAAFERYDIETLTSLLHEDATQSMPPYPLWLRGREEILRWWLGPGAGCRGSRLVPTRANGRPAFAQYRASGPGGAHEPWSLQVLEVADGRIVEMTFFLDTDRCFPLFGMGERPTQRTASA